MEKTSLTKSIIDALPLPAHGKRQYYSDARAQGLQICITWTGKRTWYVSRWAAGRSQRIRLGEYPGMTLDAARRNAAEVNAVIAHGGDPSSGARARRAEMTFGDLFEWWLGYARGRRASIVNDERQFRKHLGPLATLKLSQVTRTLLRERHAEIGRESGPYAANRVMGLVMSIFNRAISHELYSLANPAKGIELFPERSRDRRLGASEIPRLLEALEALDDGVIRDFVLLALFTGARKNNLLSMRWDCIDFAARTWRIPMTKNGLPQTVPLDNAELAILRARREQSDGPWVFPSPQGRSIVGHLTDIDWRWNRVRDRAGLPDLRVHDLRRSLGSWMVDTGASLPVIGKALNHQTQAATAIYARLSLDPVREAKARAIAAMQQAAATRPGTSGDSRA